MRRGRSRDTQVLLALKKAGPSFVQARRLQRRNTAINNLPVTMAEGPLKRSLERRSADRMPPNRAIRRRFASQGRHLAPRRAVMLQ